MAERESDIMVNDPLHKLLSSNSMLVKNIVASSNGLDSSFLYWWRTSQYDSFRRKQTRRKSERTQFSIKEKQKTRIYYFHASNFKQVQFSIHKLIRRTIMEMNTKTATIYHWQRQLRVQWFESLAVFTTISLCQLRFSILN